MECGTPAHLVTCRRSQAGLGGQAAARLRANASKIRFLRAQQGRKRWAKSWTN